MPGLVSEKNRSETNDNVRAEPAVNTEQLKHQYVRQENDFYHLEVAALDAGIYSCEVCNDIACETIAIVVNMKGNHPEGTMLDQSIH